MASLEQVPPAQINDALTRILASEKFVSTPRLARFLRFVVEKTLAGQGSELKEYLLGTEVFDRGSDFDPRLDPIVRVEARRLRAKLDEYYQGPGQHDAVRIVLPKGSYSTVFETPDTSVTPSALKSRNVSLKWVVIAGIALALAAAAYVTRASMNPKGPTIVVLPQGDEYATGLGEAVAAELGRDREIRVIAWPLVMEYLREHRLTDIRAATRQLNAEASIVINVRRDGDRLRIVGILMRADAGTKDWVGEYERGVGDIFAVQREIARTIADEAGRAISRLQ